MSQHFNHKLPHSPCSALTIRRLAMAVRSPRFGDIVSLTCAPRTPLEGTSKLRWFRYSLPSAIIAEEGAKGEEELEEVVTGEDGLHEVIEESDASGEVILRLRLTPATQGRYVCIALTEELPLTRNALMQSGLQHAPADISYHSGKVY